MRKILCTALLLVSLPAHAQEITGRVDRVIDGDTFQIRELRIRLCGIDAPEDRKPGAEASTRALELMIRGKQIQCTVVGGGSVCDTRSDVINNGRVVAQCFVGGKDIAAEQINNGHACAWRKFSGNHYAGESC